MEENFDISKFNVISDEENYYFFRSLEPGDISDLENGNIKDGENYTRLRTDRERWTETKDIPPRWNETSKISLEEMYHHIKMHYSLDTNCISLASNANVARTYGETFSDKYVIITVPKKEMGEKVFNAGQYMLSEIANKVNERIEQGNLPDTVLQDLKAIDEATNAEEIKKLIQVRYTSSKGIDINKSSMRKGVKYASAHARISSFQSLNEEQSLEKNKIIAKLTVLERKALMSPLISRAKDNSLLIQTVGSTFSSSEQIFYGDIPGKQVTDISTEMLDLFGLIQQAENQDQQTVNELKTELIKYVKSGGKLEIPDDSILRSNQTPKNDISIDEMYELTQGTVEYSQASRIIKNMYYLSKGQSEARILCEHLRRITNNNPKYEQVISYIEKNCFVVEPPIVTRKSNQGYRISESVNLDLKKNEVGLIEAIKDLTDEERTRIIQDGGLSNVRDIMTSNFAKVKTEQKVSKEEYFATAIIDGYDWSSLNIEAISQIVRNNLIQKLRQSNCIELYEKLKKYNISEKDLLTAIINISLKDELLEIINSETKTRESLEKITHRISIEQLEKYLGYYDEKRNQINLRDYQADTVNNIDDIFEQKRFASVILPTGGGKTYVALQEMLKYGKTSEEFWTEKSRVEAEERLYLKNDKKMLYLAPSNEILEQTKDRIIENIRGLVGTTGKSKDEIVKEVFPNLQFATYQSLIHLKGKATLKNQYDLIVMDELHRTGAKEWEKSLDKLIENQSETTRVLGITATPTRDDDDRNMADEMAKKLGYTDKEIEKNAHIATNITLENAIRLGLVVNPKIVSCEYQLLTDGSMENLERQIEEIDDPEKKAQKLEKYNYLRRNLEKADGISEILQQNLKKGGRYIVFVPVTQNSKGQDIEDDEGNNISKAHNKAGENKIQEYQEKLYEYLKDSGMDIECYSLLSSYSDKKNSEQLESFENDASNKVKFMVVMNKANEGLHVKGIDGIVWFRALDENSTILYSQQLGRVITSVDPYNPLQNEDRPTVIDLANNTQRVNFERVLSKNTKKSDLELLTIVVDWINRHGGILPDAEAQNNQEQRYAATLYRIQQEYIKYRSENIEEEEIEQILTKGEEIDLWDRELTYIPKEKSKKILETDAFKLKGNMHDLIELQNEVEEINGLGATDKFIAKLEKLQSIGVDVSKIIKTDTIFSLCAKSIEENKYTLIEKIKELDLDPKDNIGRSLDYLKGLYRGTVKYGTPPTEEQAEEIRSFGIKFEKEKNITNEFIKKLEALQGIGVDVSKIIGSDTILSLCTKSIEENKYTLIEKIKELNLDPEGNIGNLLTALRGQYRGTRKRETPPTEEQAGKIRSFGIRFEKERNITNEFIEKLEALQGIGVDVSKIVTADTIFSLCAKSIEENKYTLIEKIKELDLDPEGNIGNSLDYLKGLYRGTEKSGTPPTEEQAEKIRSFGIKFKKKTITAQEIGQASYSASAQECDTAQSDLERLVSERQNTKENGGIDIND